MWSGIARLPGGLVALKLVIGGLALLMLPVSLPMLWHPWGPQDTVHAVLYVAPCIAGVVLGIWWILDAKPGLRHAIVFVLWSDVLIVIGLSSLGTAGARILGTTYLAMISMLVAFLLGPRLLLVQSTYVLAVLGVHTAIGILVEGARPIDLYVYLAPTLTMEVGLPAFIQVLVVYTRVGVNRVFTERNRDPVTGGYSRQGLEHATRSLIRTRRPTAAVLAVVDLDGFKQYNDAHGHAAGDRELARTARRLRAALTDALIGRVGGDEFLVIALRPSQAAADEVVNRLRALVAGSGGTSPMIRGSAGVVVVTDPDESLIETWFDVADAALYDAKRDRTRRLVVHGESEDLAG